MAKRVRARQDPQPPVAVAEAPTSAAPGRGSLALWLATATITGAVIMVLELVAFRLYAPAFGYSVYVWGSMIGVVMIALAAGYALGGRLADRSKTDAPLYVAILAGGVYQGVILCVVGPLLARLAQAEGIDGSLVATLIIFGPPMTALAMTSPFVTRFLARAKTVGATAGAVYALATIGSIAGVFATTFLLVPTLGTRAILMLACGTTVVVGVVGLARHRPAAWLGLLAPAGLAWTPPLGWSEGALWVKESPYNLVRVLQHGRELRLVLNDETGVQSVREDSGGLTGHYFDDFALGPLLAPSKRILVLGMGAGSSIRASWLSAPEAVVDAVEIDPAVVEAGRRYFGLETGDRLRIQIADARPWLAKQRATYDIAHVDLFHGGLYQPFYLVTEEFFRQVADHLEPDGLLIMNVWDAGSDLALLSATVATLRRVFPTVVVDSLPGGSHEVFAFKSSRSLDDLRAALRRPDVPASIRPLARRAAMNLTEPAPPADTPIFTDDFAPVEDLTRRMIAEARARAVGSRRSR
ncbi:MAG TPA: fused MFS/spermidine synthase [Isosphaeraceae bacterium]|jgi:spermidine synthase|nr:fused MFS/spermidine synthase [Isosphaeraceae bacterium]